MSRFPLPRIAFAGAVALTLLLLGCATVQELLPCWVDVRVTHQARDGLEPVTPTTLADASRIVDARLASYGVERVVFTWQTDELVVGLPERWASDDVLELIVAQGRMEFVPVPAGDPGAERGAGVPADWPVLFGSHDVASVEMAGDSQKTALEFQFTERGSQLLADWSRLNLGGQLVIAVDGKVAFAPTVVGPLGEGGMELVGTDERELHWLASVLAFGPLPVELEQAAVEPARTGACPTD